MGDAADLAIQAMESGESILINKHTKAVLIKDNMDIMYGAPIKDPWIILENCDREFVEEFCEFHNIPLGFDDPWSSVREYYFP